MDDLFFFDSNPFNSEPQSASITRALPAVPTKPLSMSNVPTETFRRHTTALSARCGPVYCCGDSGLSLKHDRKHGELVLISDDLDSIHKVQNTSDPN